MLKLDNPFLAKVQVFKPVWLHFTTIYQGTLIQLIISYSKWVTVSLVSLELSEGGFSTSVNCLTVYCVCTHPQFDFQVIICQYSARKKISFGFLLSWALTGTHLGQWEWDSSVNLTLLFVQQTTKSLVLFAHASLILFGSNTLDVLWNMEWTNVIFVQCWIVKLFGINTTWMDMSQVVFRS